MASLTAEKFIERLTKGKPVPAVLLLGSDAYLRQLCRARLIEACVPQDARVWGVSRFSAADDSLDRILGQAQMQPMLAPRQVVFVEEIEAWQGRPAKGESRNEEGGNGQEERNSTVKHLGAYLDDPAPFTVLVLEAASLDKRLRLFKALSEKVLVVSVELGETPEERIGPASVIALEMARELRVELEREAAQELAECCNGDLARIHSELEKLATYVGARREISLADIEALVVSAKKYTVWQLADILAARQPSRALEFLDSLLREGEPPAALVGAMAWMYRKLIEAQELPANLTGWQAARRLGTWEKTADLAVRQSQKIPRQQLLAGLKALYEADSRLKSGPANPRAVMEFLVASLTGAASASAGHER